MTDAIERHLVVGEGPQSTTLAVRVHAVERARGSAFLVHGLASNAQMWDACAAALLESGISSAAIDLRGHGRSAALHEQAQRDGARSDEAQSDEAQSDGGPFDTNRAAADVLEAIALLRGDGTLPGPVVLAGQSWGGNVVLTAAARQPVPPQAPAPVDALALVDGGWLRFDRDESFEQLWQRLAPPDWASMRWQDLIERLEPTLSVWGPHALPAVLANLTTDEHGNVRNILDRDAHEQILRSMYEADPREFYPAVTVPVLLAPAGPGPTSQLVHEAVQGLARSQLHTYDGAHHDLHLQHPRRLAADLVGLLDARPEAHRDEEHT